MSDEIEDAETLLREAGKPVSLPKTILRRGYNGRSCTPHAPIVDSRARTVKCGVCDVTLDPIEVLCEVAAQHENWLAMRDEVKRNASLLESLKTSVTKLRATRNRLRADVTKLVKPERKP